MKSQNKRLEEHLLNGKSITSLAAAKELGISYLPARVKDLEYDGMTVHRKSITVVNRFQEKVRVNEYRLKPYEL